MFLSAKLSRRNLARLAVTVAATATFSMALGNDSPTLAERYTVEQRDALCDTVGQLAAELDTSYKAGHSKEDTLQSMVDQGNMTGPVLVWAKAFVETRWSLPPLEVSSQAIGESVRQGCQSSPGWNLPSSTP